MEGVAGSAANARILGCAARFR